MTIEQWLIHKLFFSCFTPEMNVKLESSTNASSGLVLSFDSGIMCNKWVAIKDASILTHLIADTKCLYV